MVDDGLLKRISHHLLDVQRPELVLWDSEAIAMALWVHENSGARGSTGMACAFPAIIHWVTEQNSCGAPGARNASIGATEKSDDNPTKVKNAPI